MSHWLDPLRNRLESLSTPAIFFFRDDDAGWEDKALLRLLDAFSEEDAPIDVAVIPMAISEELAATLRDRREESERRLCFHQHGFRHSNHETQGRKSEFGGSRGFKQQRQDIAAGRARLAQLLGHHVEPIFTPPWNRCTQETVAALNDLGFAALSRDATAPELALNGLAPASIIMDWAKPPLAGGAGLAARGLQIAEAAARQNPVGIMLHHACLADEDFSILRELLRFLSGHSKARLANMAQAFEVAQKKTRHD